jgi:hypothetical protein
MASVLGDAAFKFDVSTGKSRSLAKAAYGPDISMSWLADCLLMASIATAYHFAVPWDVRQIVKNEQAQQDEQLEVESARTVRIETTRRIREKLQNIHTRYFE